MNEFQQVTRKKTKNILLNPDSPLIEQIGYRESGVGSFNGIHAVVNDHGIYKTIYVHEDDVKNLSQESIFIIRNLKYKMEYFPKIEINGMMQIKVING